MPALRARAALASVPAVCGRASCTSAITRCAGFSAGGLRSCLHLRLRSIHGPRIACIGVDLHLRHAILGSLACALARISCGFACRHFTPSVGEHGATLSTSWRSSLQLSCSRSKLRQVQGQQFVEVMLALNHRFNVNVCKVAKLSIAQVSLSCRKVPQRHLAPAYFLVSSS